MKNLFIFLTILCFTTGCKTEQPVNSRSSRPSAQQKESSIEFIDNISINPEPGKAKSGTVAYTPVPRTSSNKKHSGSMEKYSDLQFKYAILENAPVEELTNTRLLEFMEEWYGTQYHYGGTSKDGIDCSAFVSLLVNMVYNIPGLPRTSRDQYVQSRRIKKTELHEGDLVFFHTLGGHSKVTHVGVYLRNNKFVHASISGVMISDMQEGYYAQRYVGGGRIWEREGE
ncbi:MAG TPA: NlpC/P60 family protein [Puia sp.]|nr:NlpC/P60 family protein [Puia sp.]